jgi:hypothetical protein
MTIKEFKNQPIPDFNFKIERENHILVQCFAKRSELASQLVGMEQHKTTEIKNAFKVLMADGSNKYVPGDIVSLGDNMVDKPIVSYKPPVGGDPNGEARPVFGSYLQGLMPFAFYCHKLEETDKPLELTFLIPEDLITVKHILN